MIDIHTHIFNEESYQSYKKHAGNSVEKILTIHVPFDDGLHPPTLTELISFAQSKEDMGVIAGVDMERDIPEQLRALEPLLVDKKIVGLKLYPGYQHTPVSSATVIPVATWCAEHGVPLTIHGGDFYDPAGTALLHDAHPIHVDTLAVAVPGCKIIIAHFGFPYLLETANIVAKNKNVYVDISGTVIDCGSQELNNALLKRYVEDLSRVFDYFPIVRSKTMFGTDYAGEKVELRLFKEYVEVAEQLFAGEERERMLRGLAKELFSL